MAIPKKLRIFGVDHKVTVSDKLPVDAKELGMSEDLMGLAWVLEDKIWINKSIPGQSQTKVLLHEAVHHLLYKSGVSQSVPAELEEVLCQLFAHLYTELKKQGV